MVLTVQFVINLMFGFCAVISTLFICAIMFAPVMPFVLSRLLPDRVPLFILQAGGRIKVVTAKIVSGTLVTKKHGTYRETPNSGYIHRRQMIFFAADNYGSTMPFDYAMVIQTLRERGYEINTFDDLEKLWKDPAKKEEIIGLHFGRTLRIKDMQYMYPANDNPYINEAKEATEVAIERAKRGQDYFKWILVIGGIVIVAYIAYSLFKSYGKAPEMPPVSVICKYPEYVMNQMASNFTM